MTAKLLTDQHLVFLKLKGGCTGSSETTFAKMTQFWKSHVAAQRGTCIKGLFWPRVEPKTEICFSLISSYWFVRRIAQV